MLLMVLNGRIAIMDKNNFSDIFGILGNMNFDIGVIVGK